VRFKIVQLVNLAGSLISTLYNYASALRNHKLTKVHAFCGLNVNEVRFVYTVALI